MNMFPKVSVIIPIYKVERYIERCVRSLFEQTLDDIEYVFVNDCTPDRSIEILNNIIKEYPAKGRQIKIISHSHNKGIASTRNTGLDNATGEYIGWVDSDDWVEKNMFESLLFTANKFDADIVWCDYSIGDRIISQRTLEYPKMMLDAIMKEQIMASLWNKLIRRNLFLRHNIRFVEHINFAEDFNVLLRALRFSLCIKYISESFYHYNVNIESLTCRKDQGHRQRDNIINMVRTIEFLSLSNWEKISPEDIRIYKLMAKRCCLFSVSIEDLKFWFKTFPEVNSYVLSCPYTNLRYRILGWMAAHQWWIAVRICILIKKQIQKGIKV